MKLIKSSFEILEQNWDLDSIYKQIEIGGRTAYRSEDKITENSAKEFVDRIIKSGHGSVLEHGTVYLTISITSPLHDIGYLRKMDAVRRYKNNPYSKVSEHTKDNFGYSYYITTNMRVIKENQWDFDLQYLCEPTEYHERRVSVRIVCDQGVLREFSRHRAMSLTVESTRYCNYSNSKFGNEITYIQPSWMNPDEISTADVKWDEYAFIESLKVAEKSYFQLLKMGWKPQQARNVLPLATKTEMVMTGFVSDWNHFFSLRDHSSAHPQAMEIAHGIHEEFFNQKYLLK